MFCSELAKGKWIVSQHPFPARNPEGVTFHVYKKHWFNEEAQGIHFELYLPLDPKKQKKTYVTLHALHYDLIPGLGISWKKFSQPLVDLIFDEVSSWVGYSFRAGRYGLQPFTCVLDGSSAQFEIELAGELERLCKSVGPRVDSVLTSLDPFIW